VKRVAIVILNWNGYKDTKECLDSLKKIDYSNYEIIVVDNGSIDGSAEKIEREFPYVKLIRNSDNLGFAEGNNVGIREAMKGSPDYVLLLNNDVIVDKGFLSELIDVAEKDPSIGIVGPKIYYYDEPDRIWLLGTKIELIRNKLIGYREVDKGQYDRIMEFDTMIGACFLIKRSVIAKIGFLDPDYFLKEEETDFSIRAGDAGFKNIYVPTSKVWHKVASATQGEDSPYNLYYASRNLLLMYKKNHRLTLFFHLRTFLKVLIYLALLINPQERRKAAAVLSGIFDYYKGKVGKSYICEGAGIQ
jgi:GT2 family glycosyltransferase